MGQIVIDIPNKASRRYKVEKAADARKLLGILDDLLSGEEPLRSLTKQQLQDLRDGIESERILNEWRQTGNSVSVEELRKELGLS